MARTSVVDADSLLAVEIGSVNTRALLFDTVENRYRFIASGVAPTTAGAPMHDAGEGVHLALDRLYAISGRLLIGQDEGLIIPTAPDGAGVDRFVSTISAGPPLKILATGLLEGVSLQSLRRLAGTINAEMVAAIGLSDGHRLEDQIDTILRQRPDVLLIAGGTDEGASRSVLKMVAAVEMALGMLPATHRPEVLFAGNNALHGRITNKLEPLSTIHLSPNVRPGIDVENLRPAKRELDRIYSKIISRKILGVQELNQWSGGRLMPASTAFGRVIRFLSTVYDPGKGVFGVDVGASSTTVASAFGGELDINVYPSLGVGEGVNGLLEEVTLEDIARWVPYRLPDNYIRDYLYNKGIHPATLPAVPEDLAIEQALTRQVLRVAVRRAAQSFPPGASRPAAPGMLPFFEPIMVGGSVIANSPDEESSLLMILDGLQPTGVARLILDKHSLTTGLGAAAAVNSLLAVQVLESSSFVNLGTLIAPVGRARHGTPILRLKIVYDTGQENTLEIRSGVLQRIPLPPGRSAQLHLRPLQRFDVGFGGPGRAGRLRVGGGRFGVIVDARGRPLRLPASPERRRELIKRWLLALKS